MPKKNVQSPAVGNSRKEYTSATQTLLEVWQTLVNHSSAEKPLSVPEICSLMKENSLHASPSAATLKRVLPSKADILNTLHPNKVLSQEDLPNILLSYFSDHTLHVVLEDRLGEVIKEADCTVIVEPKAEILPPCYSTVEMVLQKLMAANADALFPLRLKCVRLENAPSGKRYIPYVEWEERYEKEGLKNNQARRYYLESILTPAEWRIFSDLVQVYPHISKAQTDKFLGVLKKFSPELESRINRRYAFKRGSGMQFAADCREDARDKHWQRLVLTHLEEKQHLGVLTGAPLTDVKITLLTGKAHLKHTEGGDFRQATYRAVRQGLMLAKSQLLEPWYAFRLEVPVENIGRAMSDIQRMEGSFDPPESGEEAAVLTGFAPVATMRSYPMEVVSYTRGRGHLNLTLDGYRPCHNAAEIIEAVGYEPEHDLDNPADSVFCAHGAGFVVPWDQVRSHMHVDSGWGKSKSPEQETQAVPQRRTAAYRATLEEDAELLKIFERTYGPIKRDPLAAFRPVQKRERPDFAAEQWEIAPEYLLVDGYNIIFAWDELNALSKESLDAARHRLMDILCNYQGFKKCVLILVFDAYKVKGGTGSVEKRHGIHIVYTREAETADMYIEQASYDLSRRHRVRVATSDGMEQMIILGHGAERMSATELKWEVEQADEHLHGIIQNLQP